MSIFDNIRDFLIGRGYTVETIQVDKERGTIWVAGLEITIDKSEKYVE